MFHVEYIMMQPLKILFKTATIFLLAFLLLLKNDAEAQKFLDPLKNTPANLPFEQVQKIVNAYYDTTSKERGSDYKQWKRYEWWASRHIGEDGKVQDAAKRNAEVLRNELIENNVPESTNGEWVPLGPTSINNDENELGRVVCIAFHPTNASTFYLGTPAGGLWKTTNGGSSYVPLTDHLPGLGIASILIHPTIPDIMWILTGDGNASHRGHYLKESGTGIYKSYDGGITWNETNLNWAYSEEIYGYKLLMHPTNPSIIYAATSNGVWRSADAGINWTQRLANVEITDIELDPNSSTRIYAAGYSRRFYYSSNSGTSWDSTLIGTSTADRMEIAVSPNAPDNVWVLMGPGYWSGTSFRYVGLYRSQDNGIAGSWSSMHSTPNILGYADDGADDFSQTWRNISLYVSPTNANTILSGGSFIWKSTSGGSSFTKSSGIIHADNHFIVKHPLNNDLYSGCDGGLYKSTNAGASWINITGGLQITQYYRLSGTPQSLSRILTGAQDNGHHFRNGTSSFAKVLGADGMDNAINSYNSNIMYACIQNGKIYKCTDGQSFSSNYISQPTSGNDYWVTNFILHPTRPDTIYFGGTGSIRRSFNGAITWSDIGSNGKYYLAQGYSNTGRIYAASDLVTNGLTIQTTSTANAASPTWTTISGGSNYPAAASGKFITGMVVNPDNSNEMWFTLSGYFQGQKVYRTLDAGVSWQNMSGFLPNMPIHCIAFEDNNGAPGGAVYIGTEMGVFYRNNDLSGWRRFGNQLPNSPVTDLYIYKSGGISYITAATFGRGLWRSPTFTDCVQDLIVSGEASGYTFHQANNSVHSSNVLVGGLSSSLYLSAGNYVDLKIGFEAMAASGYFNAGVSPCNFSIFKPDSLLFSYFDLNSNSDLIVQPFLKSADRGLDNDSYSDVSIQYEIDIRETGSINVYLENENNALLSYLYTGLAKKGKYSISILKPRVGAGPLFIVIEEKGKKYKIKV